MYTVWGRNVVQFTVEIPVVYFYSTVGIILQSVVFIAIVYNYKAVSTVREDKGYRPLKLWYRLEYNKLVCGEFKLVKPTPWKKIAKMQFFSRG